MNYASGVRQRLSILIFLWLCVFFPAGRKATAMRLPVPHQQPQGAVSDPLEQALQRYMKDQELKGIFRTAVKYLPEGEVRDTYKKALAHTLEDFAIVKRDHTPLDQFENVSVVLMKSLAFSEQLNQFNPAPRKEIEAAMARLQQLNATTTSVDDSFLWRAIDETAAPATVDRSADAPKTRAPSAPLAPDALLQQAVDTIPVPVQKPMAQQVLSRMDSDVKRVIAQMATQAAKHFHTSPLPMARSVVLGLAVDLTRAPGATAPDMSAQALADLVKTSATDPGALDSAVSALNTLTRHSRSYINADWEPPLVEYSRDKRSAYMDAHLVQMLSEALRNALSQKPASANAAP